MDYVVFGKGKKPLVIIPGLSLRTIKGTAVPLAQMYRIFSERYRVFVFDRAEYIPADCTVKDLAEDVFAAVNELGIKKADVIGISQGGIIALELTLAHPGFVHKLALGVTLSRPNDTVRAAVSEWVKLAKNNDTAGLLNDMLLRIYSEEYVRKFGKFFPIFAKTAELIPFDRFIVLARSILSCNVYERLTEINCPVFVIGGELDNVVGREASREIAEKLGCSLYIYENLGHSAYEEAKDFNKRIFEFFIG